MVVRVEERVACVASPAPGVDAQRRVCTATFEGTRYVFYALDALLVVLHENHSGAVPNNPRSETKRSSQFDLWQVWNLQDSVKCVRFNTTTSQRVARGALALCLDEGRVVLMTPNMATAHLPTAAPPLVRTASRLTIKTSDADLKPVSSSSARMGGRRTSLFGGRLMNSGAGDVTSEYIKVHMHLQLPTWQESIRWKADDDRHMDRIEWVESGDDLWLVGVGEKVTTWKLVEESGIVAYQQMSFPIGDPDQRVWYMDITQTGRFVATSGLHDRIVKVWALRELAHDGIPVCLYLPHKRALTTLSWSKSWNAYKIQGNQLSHASHSEQLFTVDRIGTITIWKENVASPGRAFTKWKTFNTYDFFPQSGFDGDTPSRDGADTSAFTPVKSWGLVVNNWARPSPRVPGTFTDALLEEANVLAALSQFHYGCTSLDEVRRNELLNQRMDGIPKLNSRLLGGGKTGMIADTHAGETLICGNQPIHKAFIVNLGFGVHDNGDFSLFRIESIPFSGVSPRTSLLCMFSGLKDQLCGASIYTVTSADFKDRENGSSSFVVEILFQPRTYESQLKVARLKLQVDSTIFGGTWRGSRSSVSYAVQMCEVADLSPSVISAYKGVDTLSASVAVSKLHSSHKASSTSSSAHIAIVASAGQIDIVRAASYLGAMKVGCRAGTLLSPINAKPTHSVSWEAQHILFTFADGKLYAFRLLADSPSSLPPGVPSVSNGNQGGYHSITPKIQYSDDDEDADGIEELIICGSSLSQKTNWSYSPTGLFFSTTPIETASVPKDFCVVLGLKPDRQTLMVWVFSVELPAQKSELTENDGVSVLQGASTPPLELYRRATVEVPHGQRLLCIASTPSLDPFGTTFVSVDASTHHLSLWGFTDMDELSSLQSIHATDISSMLQAASSSSVPNDEANMRFFAVETKHEFRELAVSECGRVALLFDDAPGEAITDFSSTSSVASVTGGTAQSYICVVSLFDSWHESVVQLSQKKYGDVLSIKWTPPRTPSMDCQIIFLTAGSVGIVSLGCDGTWGVSWCSSRLTAKPLLLSDMTRYPLAFINLRAGIAALNLDDLVGSGINTSGSLADASNDAANPMTILFLLMRGSFRSLDKIVQHVKQSMIEHKKACYLRMLDDQELHRLPFIELEKLLGTVDEAGNDSEERSTTFTKGKGGSASTSTASVSRRGSLARASDLFAMDFGSVRRSSLALGLSSGLSGDSSGGSLLISSSTLGATITGNQVAEDVLELESNDTLTFFVENEEALHFVPDGLRMVFIDVISACKKIISWDKDTGRLKDEAALRFVASLLWPYKQTVPSAGESSASEGSDEVHQAGQSESDEPVPVGGIHSEQVVWAALSDYQNEILQECFPAPTITLTEIQQLRLPFWLKSSAKLVHFVEKAAQTEYASTRDPFRVALLYVALGKTKLLASLFKMSNEAKIGDLLQNDFTEARWKNAAVKNAYVLKAKRRHELSAAFFLLGGKVQEAMSVAEQADATLVLSFLIGRLSEKWDLGGSNRQSDAGESSYADMSFTGLSSNMRSLQAIRSTAQANNESTDFTDGCKEYLKTVVWNKAEVCGDIYMAFLVKYLTGETMNAIQSLLTIPTTEVTCMFDVERPNDAQSSQRRDPRSMYWQVFGQSLLGASELVRYLRPSIPRLTAAVKIQEVQLQAVVLSRLSAMGCNISALYQQRDFAPSFKQFCKDNISSQSVEGVRAAFLAVRCRILVSTMSAQTKVLLDSTSKRIANILEGRKSSFEASLPSSSVTLEDRLDAQLRCLTRRAGQYFMEDLPETSEASIEAILKTTVLETLHQAGQPSIEEFIYSHWNSPLSRSNSSSPSPLQQLLESAIDGIAAVASGDLVTSATTTSFSKHVDQICAELLHIAEKLLCWLVYFFHERAASTSSRGSSADYLRLVTATVYSVICVCSRYIKSPCCVYRSLSAIFPHMDPLPKKVLDAIEEIALADVCEYCSSHKKMSATIPAVASSSLQQDIPALYRVIRMLRQNLQVFVEEVRTNRLDLSPPASFFSHCQYWTLVSCIATTMMPGHVTKLAIDGPPSLAATTSLARRLAQVWVTYSSNLTKFSARILLCELTASYFRPYNARATATPTGSTPVTPRESNATSSSSPSTATTVPSPSLLSPSRDRRESRQLLRCTCDRCPWLLILKMFADKDELLLRVNSRLECCGEKIKEEISWGHLPDFPSKKAALTRSQKILLSTAAAGKGPDLTDLLEKRMLQSSPSIQLDAHCIYRSEVSIKSMSFNRATETAEMILCSSRGICRTASVEYSDGTKYQFKGMYANPQTSFVAESAIPMTRRTTTDGSAMLGRTPADISRGTGDGSTSEMKTPSFKPTSIESHPFLPLFVSGNQKGNVHLWSYESLSSVCEFQTSEVVATYPLSPALSSRRDIKKIHFDRLGQQMGAVDNVGRLFMWKFANLDRDTCYRQIDCHDKGAKALQFINSGSIVATAGSSSDKRSVCMWDLLLPNSKALIAAPSCHPAGAASLTFSPTHQLLISGGEGGSISVFDVRQRRVLHTITNAHETAITTLELHPSGRCALSGSASGDVKIWSLPIFRELVAVSKVHAKPSFLGDAASNILGDAASNMAINVTNSSWGVTDAFATDDYFYTSGTDGSVQRFRVPSVGSLL